jgi:Lrp/AsnC family leucine-responsive transcriptional regulator
MAVELDRTDARILAALQRDGRVSIVELADQVGLSPTPCARRVKRLEDDGVIEGYAAVVNPRRVGHAVQAFVQVKLERHTDETTAQFRTALDEFPEVVACYAMTGEMDFLLHVLVQDIDALGQFTLHRLLRLPGVRDVRSSLVLETIKRSRSVPVGHLSR